MVSAHRGWLKRVFPKPRRVCQGWAWSLLAVPLEVLWESSTALLTSSKPKCPGEPMAAMHFTAGSIPGCLSCSAACVSFPGHLQLFNVLVLGLLGHFGIFYPPALASVPIVLLPHSQAQGKGSCPLLVGSTAGWGKGVHEQLQQRELGKGGLF